jgi:GDP-L-fucose synthase
VYINFLSSVGVYASAEEFVEDTVWSTLPSKHDWYPAWSKRIPELILEAYKRQYGFINWTILRPSNIFGEYDNFGENAMAIPATIKKVFESDGEIEAWGDGTPIRDYVYAEDVAEACLSATEQRLHCEIVNIGSGVEITIKEMIETVCKVSGKDIKINWDTSKPNGEPKRKMNTGKQAHHRLLPKLGFEEGIRKTYEHYKKTMSNE